MFNAPVMWNDKDNDITKSFVYVTAKDGQVYAFRASDGLYLSRKPDAAVTEITTSAGVGPDGTVYVGANNQKVYALNGTNLTNKPLWSTLFTASGNYSSSPALGSDSTVYIGDDSPHLYALGSDGVLRWQIPPDPPATSPPVAGKIQSTPFIDSNGTVYFGSNITDPFSNSKNVYSLYSDGTQKWLFDTGSGNVIGTPVVKGDGTVYVGSTNGNFYAINQFATPKSIRDKSITSVLDGGVVKVGGIPATVTSENNWLNGDATKGPWAVRLEVYRSFDANITAPVGYYKYELRSWVRQCNQADCSDLIGTFYDDAQVTYSPVLRLPQMTQTINLSSTDNTNFQRFLFGFSSQTAAGDIQTSTIRNFKLSFVRPTSPVIVCDPNWPESTICP